jgi:hypothetical protein
VVLAATVFSVSSLPASSPPTPFSAFPTLGRVVDRVFKSTKLLESPQRLTLVYLSHSRLPASSFLPSAAITVHLCSAVPRCFR